MFFSPTLMFLTGVTQFVKRIKIMCAVTAMNCKSGNPAYPLPDWGDNEKLCKGTRKRTDPFGIERKIAYEKMVNLDKPHVSNI